MASDRRNEQSLCFLDRTNIGNAKLDNLEGDLHLVGIQYNDCLAILFPFYIAAEIPSNMMMKRVRPSVWLCFIMVFWSAAMIAQGFVKNYAGLMATRVFLGAFEGGLYPGVNYYITQWYCRHECGLRMALFFSAATLAGAFGGILARGIAEMSGVGGLSAWSWIFILEGLLSILVSFTAYWAIYNYPDTSVAPYPPPPPFSPFPLPDGRRILTVCPCSARFLTTDERREVIRRLDADTGHLSNDYKRQVRVAGGARLEDLHPHVDPAWPASAPSTPSRCSCPTIIKNMGNNSANTSQLLSVPPYVCACFSTIAISWVADRYRPARHLPAGLPARGPRRPGHARRHRPRRRPVRRHHNRRRRHLLADPPGARLEQQQHRRQPQARHRHRHAGHGWQLRRHHRAATPISTRDAPRFITGHSILIGFVGSAPPPPHQSVSRSS